MFDALRLRNSMLALQSRRSTTGAAISLSGLLSRGVVSVRYIVLPTLWPDSTIKIPWTIQCRPMLSKVCILDEHSRIITIRNHTSNLVKNCFQFNNVSLLYCTSRISIQSKIFGESWNNELERFLKISISHGILFKKTWIEMQLEICRKLIARMPKRANKIIENKGRYAGV